MPSQAFIVAAILLLLVSSQVSGVCDCWYGATVSTSPCKCQCTDPYLDPYCAFTASQTAIVLTSLSTPKSVFVSGALESALRTALGLNSTDSSLSFRIIDGNPENPFRAEHPTDLIVQWSMTGPIASRFLQDVQTGTASYIAANNITAANINNLVAAPKSDLGSSLVLYSADPIVITVNTVGWVIGLILLFVLTCVECCCVTNSTVHSQQLADEERVLKEHGGNGVVAGVAISMHQVFQGNEKSNPLEHEKSPPQSPRPRSTQAEEEGSPNLGATAADVALCDPNYVSDPPAASAENDDTGK